MFEITFAVVPDNSISYDGLLGRDFIHNTPGLTVNFSSEISFTYEKPISEILLIDAITESSKNVDYLSLSKIGDKVPFEKIESLKEIVERYYVLLPNAEPIVYEMEINVTTNEPFHFSPRRLSWSERQELKKVIDDLLRRKIIRPSKSKYCSPIVLIRRKDGTIRVCVDYRELNKHTERYNFPLPRMDDVIDRLSGKKWFTCLDLKDGFHQMRHSENSIKYTAFGTPDGFYEYLRAPFGAANSPANFQRFLSLIFEKLIREEKLYVYLDDFMIATVTLEENLTILDEVLQLMAHNGLELKWEKCQFALRASPTCEM